MPNNNYILFTRRVEWEEPAYSDPFNTTINGYITRSTMENAIFIVLSPKLAADFIHLCYKERAMVAMCNDPEINLTGEHFFNGAYNDTSSIIYLTKDPYKISESYQVINNIDRYHFAGITTYRILGKVIRDKANNVLRLQKLINKKTGQVFRI